MVVKLFYKNKNKFIWYLCSLNVLKLLKYFDIFNLLNSFVILIWMDDIIKLTIKKGKR